MHKEYSLNVKVDTKKALLPSEAEADIYLDKRHGWLSLATDAKWKGEVYEVKRTKSSTKIRTNTEAILLTNVVIRGTPYFYRVVSLRATSKNVHMPSKYIAGATLHEGEWYCNTPFYLFNDDEYIFTERVIDKYEATYKLSYIEITTLPDVHYKIGNLIVPQLINPFYAYIPSFYLGKQRYIESNIRIFTSKASSEVLPYKVEEGTEGCSKEHNMLFGEPEDVLFRHSSHCLFLKRMVSYFTLTPDGSIAEGSENFHSFKITKEIDTSKIVVFPNNYIREGEDILPPTVLSLREVDDKVNELGVSYRPIGHTTPRYNYLGNIMFNTLGTSGIQMLTKSLKEDAYKLTRIPPLPTEDFKTYDGRNYYV